MTVALLVLVSENSRESQQFLSGCTVDWREAKTREVAGGSFSSDDQGFDADQTYFGYQCGNQRGGQTGTSCAFRHGKPL